MNAARDNLVSRLKPVRRRLLVRAGVRAAVMGLGGAGIAILIGALFLAVLPRLLWGAPAGTEMVVAAGVIGAIAGAARELRGFRYIELSDAALAMEARLEHHSGALGLALGLAPEDRFSGPVAGRAASDLDKAEREPAPAVVTTRRLLWVPAVCLLAGLSLAYLLAFEAPDAAPGPQEKAPEVAGGWGEVDVGGARSEADHEAYREALNMKEAEGSLRRSAETLRDSDASTSEQQRALDDARQDIEAAPEGYGNEQPLPATVPADAEAREDLAARIDDAAARIGAAADRKLERSEGTRDTGRDGEFEGEASARNLVPFPALQAKGGEAHPEEASAMQSPARRALAQRAVKAYERLQHP